MGPWGWGLSVRTVCSTAMPSPACQGCWYTRLLSTTAAAVLESTPSQRVRVGFTHLVSRLHVPILHPATPVRSTHTLPPPTSENGSRLSTSSSSASPPHVIIWYTSCEVGGGKKNYYELILKGCKWVGGRSEAGGSAHTHLPFRDRQRRGSTPASPTCNVHQHMRPPHPTDTTHAPSLAFSRVLMALNPAMKPSSRALRSVSYSLRAWGGRARVGKEERRKRGSRAEGVWRRMKEASV